MLDVVERIRRANASHDHSLADRLNERLAQLLSESPEHLLMTRELAEWQASPDQTRDGDALAADSLDELRALILALGPGPSWH